MVNDVRRAYFHSPCKRDLCIELPAEDVHGNRKTQLGKLNLSLHGTRDAACNWQETLAEHLHTLGFIRGTGYPSVFVHHHRKILTMVHGDDYAAAGPRSQVTWLRQELEKSLGKDYVKK